MNEARRQGLGIFMVAGGVTLIMGAMAMKLVDKGYNLLGWGWGVPGAFALAGLVQLISGIRFSELSARWASLEGWQRGLYGTLIVVLATALLLGILLTYARLAYG